MITSGREVAQWNGCEEKGAYEQDSPTNDPLGHFEWRLPTRADEPLEIPKNWNDPVQH
jgi:hypothetical protein